MKIDPNATSHRLRRIASILEDGGVPSKLGAMVQIGKVLVALEGDVFAPANPVGDFAAPVGQVLAHLGEWLLAKYRIDAAYRSYADRVKGPWRDSLVDHWYGHAKEERDQGYDLAMKIVALGGDPILTSIDVPPATANLGGFCMSLIDLEVKAIEKGYTAIQLAGNNGPLRVLAEEIMLVDSKHLDDLRRMCASFDIGMGA